MPVQTYSAISLLLQLLAAAHEGGGHGEEDHNDGHAKAVHRKILQGEVGMPPSPTAWVPEGCPTSAPLSANQHT